MEDAHAQLSSKVRPVRFVNMAAFALGPKAAAAQTCEAASEEAARMMRTTLQKLGWLAALAWAISWSATGWSAEIRVPATCIDVYDGDTFTVELTPTVTIPSATVDGRRVHQLRVPLRINVRLIDLATPGEPRGVWAPERATREPGWEESRNSLMRMALNKRGTLIIDTTRAENPSARRDHTQNNVSNLFTMGRLLADFHVDGYRATVGRRQVNAGHAFRAKDEQEARR